MVSSAEAERPSARTGMSDKIPGLHSDLIIAMILSRADDLFADNRKRKPVFNARRKAKWRELVDGLNQQLGMDYSVERVKNNYHYRVTSLKRNMGKQLASLKEGEDITDTPAYQQLTEIDRLLYNVVKQQADGEDIPSFKKAKLDTKAEDIVSRLFTSSSDENSTSIDQIFRVAEDITEMASASSPSSADESFKNAYLQLIQAQTNAFTALGNFMSEQAIQQAKIVEMMTATVELVRESAAQLEKANNPCAVCTGNLLERIVQTCTEKPSETRTSHSV